MAHYLIGMMLGTKHTDYPHAMRLGVQNTLEGLGHTLIPIADLVPYHTHAHGRDYLPVAFELAARLDLDAVIVPAGTVAGYLNNDNELMEELVRLLDPAKTVVVERTLEGLRCIGKDNASGIHACMRHLIDDCGFTRIAFVSGSALSNGARVRETAYFEEMAAHGLPVQDGWFVRGDFSGECADKIERLLDDHPDIQAIACASDLIAFCAYRVLRRRGLTVGKDIAVTGFDDHPDSAHLDPPLSTVHLTGYDMGCAAAREALRVCEGLPQEEYGVGGSFIVRNSCGEPDHSDIAACRELLQVKPFPEDRAVELMVRSTISMAGERVTRDFTRDMRALVQHVRGKYLDHMARRASDDDRLFSGSELAALFKPEYRDYLSLEGFHSVVIALLDTIAEQCDVEDKMWVIEQMSQMHLRVARLLNRIQITNELSDNLREWHTLHVVVDAVLQPDDPIAAYQSMMKELLDVGVQHADLFLLPESATLIGNKSLALSDTLLHVASLSDGNAIAYDTPEQVSLQRLLPTVLPHYGGAEACTVGGVMAGTELMGVMVLDTTQINDNGQMMILLQTGLALKHLQTMAHQRELNELLLENNLKLELESQRDELTGLLNRRGLNDAMQRVLKRGECSLYALIYLDLDGLKTINDSFGHDAGDEAIRTTARLLTENSPSDGILARMGGDEFVLFAGVDHEDEGDVIGARMQAALDRYNAHQELPYLLHISYGSAAFCPMPFGDGNATRQAMLKADERMYQMKKNRRESRRYQG